MRLVLDHFVVHVSDWDRSGAFHSRALGAEIVPAQVGYALRVGDQLSNCHRPGKMAEPVEAKLVLPGNSDLRFARPGPINPAVAHLEREDASVGLGPVERTGAKGSRQSVYVRDPDGSLLEFLSHDR